MRSLLCCIILFFTVPSSGWTQVIEAINEDTTRQVQFQLNRGVICEVTVADRPVVVRGKLVSIDSASFQLKLTDGYYTTILIDQLLRMRYRRYTRQHLAGAGAGSSLYSGVSGSSTALIPLVAVSALTGLGMAMLSEQDSFRRKDPSSYQGWTFKALLK